MMTFNQVSELLKRAAMRRGRPSKLFLLSLRSGFWETATEEELAFIEREGLRDSRGRRLSVKRKIATRRKQLQQVQPMIPKPLTKEEREGVMRTLMDWPKDKDIQALLAAEAYWRNAVKKSKDPFNCLPRGQCRLCSELAENDHAPDCPWLKAQEEA